VTFSKQKRSRLISVCEPSVAASETSAPLVISSEATAQSSTSIALTLVAVRAKTDAIGPIR